MGINHNDFYTIIAVAVTVIMVGVAYWLFKSPDS